MPEEFCLSNNDFILPGSFIIDTKNFLKEDKMGLIELNSSLDHSANFLNKSKYIFLEFFFQKIFI